VRLALADRVPARPGLDPLRLFLSLLRYDLKKTLHYRWGAIVPLVMDPLMLALYVSLLRSIYQHGQLPTLVGYSLTQMIWYFGATRFFFCLVMPYTDKILSDSIVSGSLVTKLLKPVSVLALEFSSALAAKVSACVFEFIPTLAIYCLLVPPSFLRPASFAKYLALSFLAFVLFFLFTFLLGLVAFAWQNADGFFEIKTVVLALLAGAFVPLDFFPGAVVRAIGVLPFQHTFYTPVRIFLGMPGTQSAAYFAHAAGILCLWIVLLYGLARVLWTRHSQAFGAVG
jgi:ABC-2 type transport system permease protein